MPATYTAFEIVADKHLHTLPGRARYYEASGYSLHVNPRTNRNVVRYDQVNPYAVESIAGPRMFQDPAPVAHEFEEYPTRRAEIDACCLGSTRATIACRYGDVSARCTCEATIRLLADGRWVHHDGQVECPAYECGCGKRHNTGH